MFKIVKIYIGNVSQKTVYSINEIDTDEETVVLPTHTRPDGTGSEITRLGYRQMGMPTGDDYEQWKDRYYYNYIPDMDEVATDVLISPSVKKIFIPKTITHISSFAFRNVGSMVFEIDSENPVYKVEDNKIVEISSGEVIWPSPAQA